ncbi:hypothetical protein ACFT2C_04820 [Promicromonospora sp. NPDC057138]|uniref:hypothetical protein n=1 Tax=Promicromonospora sp. NPDC057138 TaxID=3346031 RepID=UPI003637147E
MAFEEDEFEEPTVEVVQADPDMLLEVLAKNKHYGTPATDAHRNIAAQLWPHLKALEYTTGRLLAIGSDIDLLAGAPPGSPRVADYLDGYEVGDTLATDLPGAGQSPHHGLRLRPALDDDIGRADLVLANIPLADTRALTRENKIDVTLAHHQVIRDTLDWLRPGGLLVTLAHRQLLDGTDAQPRRSIARHADLIAAARLPASALRKAPCWTAPSICSCYDAANPATHRAA